MPKVTMSVALLLILCAFIPGDDNYQYRYIPNTCFNEGEVIKYRAHYGFINAAVGEMVISDKLYRVNGRTCYKIDVYGKSVGMFDVFLRIRDNWGTYLDTTSITTQKFYRYIEEGKYRKKEIVSFDQENHAAKVKTWDKHKKEWKPEEVFTVPGNVQDLVSGYYFMRTLKFDTFQKGDTISIDAFFDDEVYDFKIRFLGREKIKTDLGRIRSLVLSPIMPKNSLFDGEDAVRVWISDDINKVPLKIRAEMFVGGVELDITSYDKGDIK